MEDNITLKDIYFGRADGSQEAEEKNFENLFYKGNKKYDLLNEDIDKFIISGRKGTGKTILAKYFEKEKNKENIPTKILNKRELILKIYLEKGKYELDRQESELFIEYTLLCEIAKIVLENKEKFIKIKNIFKAWGIYQNVKKLENLVNDRFPDENFVLESFSTGADAETATNGEVNSEVVATSVGVKTNTSRDEKYKKSSYFQIIDGIKKALFYLMKIMPVNIIFDDLDEMEEKLDENDRLIKFLIDFIEVANSLNTQFRKQNIANSRVIILIRSDIIKILNENSSNLNKIIADSEIRLNWMKRTAETTMHPLMELIVTKIKKSNKNLNRLSNSEIMKKFFPVTVNGIPIMNYMLNGSFGRPRDIINMLNIIRNEYPEKEYFSADLFKTTQQEYSIKFTDELRNELSTHYDKTIIEECFYIIHAINKRTFWITDIEKTMNECQDKIKYFKSKEDFADFIYEYGIVANIWKSGKNNNKRKYNFSWKYREDGFDTPDYNKKFYLHNALRKTLLG